MKATGIVRRIDDLGRVVIPKEIRRTMRIREGDPLEIYTDTDGQVIFKKYSPMGELSEFAAQICDALHKTTGGIAAVCDRDAVIAVAGGGKRELLDRRISRELEELMSTRGQYAADSCTLSVVDTDERYAVAVAAPILSEGDVLGCVLFVAGHGDGPAGETERKLAQAVSGFLGKNASGCVHALTRFRFSIKKASGRPRRPFAADAAVMDTRPVRCRHAPRSLWRDEICHAAENKKGR